MAINLRRWQLCFLTGVVVALGLFWAFAGSAVLTGTAAAAALVLGILHGLLTRPAEGVTPANWLAAAVQRMLTVTPFLKSATVLIWIGILCSAVLWSQFSDITGRVVTAQGELPNDAQIVLRYGTDQHASTVTNKGEFHFSHVWLPRLFKSTANLQVQWHTARVLVSEEKR